MKRLKLRRVAHFSQGHAVVPDTSENCLPQWR
jgi:hypothetical protein